MMVARTYVLTPALALALACCGMNALAAPPAHLEPFPEDAAEKAAAGKPVKPEPPKSTFQPRFRAPSVKSGESLEPTAADTAKLKDDGEIKDDSVVPASASEPVAEGAAEPAGETPLPGPAAEKVDGKAEGPQLLPGAVAEPAALQGREALNEAFTLSKKAASEEEYSAIIALCERGKVGVPKQYQDYADQLTGWAYNRRGEARAKAGQDTQALADFEAAVRLNGVWRAIHNRGVSYAAAGRMEEAMADFDKTIQLNPGYSNAYYNRGELRYRQEDYMGAVEDYSQALKIGPADAATYNGRGHAFYRLQKFGDALRDYGEAIKLDPSNPDPLINRGDTNSDLGKYGEAAADYRAAVKVAPENARGFQAAAWLMATCPDAHYRDEALAIDAAKRAIELEGPTYRNLSTLAAAQASANQFAEAQATQEKAIAAAPKEQVLTGEKMMSLYQRDIAYRDRPMTAYDGPEQMSESQVKQAAATEPVGEALPQGRQALFQAANPRPPVSRPQPPAARAPGPQPRGAIGRYGDQGPPAEQPPARTGLFQQFQGQQPPAQQTPPAQRARLFGPKGKI
jgi:tetratricopeptide (TPR) repeat protein